MRKEIPENEYGDKIGFSDICAGIALLIAIATLTAGLFVRGCQSIKKHKPTSKPKVVQVQNEL